MTRAVTALDKDLFDAYNTCNLDKLGTLVVNDLEFYHDKTELAVGKQTFLDAIKNNICGKVTRQLVPGTLEVYPLHWIWGSGDWGAPFLSSGGAGP